MLKLTRIFPCLFLVVITLNFLNCDKESDSIDDEKGCANATDQQVVVEFASNIVSHEYIVQFSNYYQKESRRKFLKAAFDNNNVSVGSHYHEICDICSLTCSVFGIFVDKKLDNCRSVESSERLSERL